MGVREIPLDVAAGIVLGAEPEIGMLVVDRTGTVVFSNDAAKCILQNDLDGEPTLPDVFGSTWPMMAQFLNSVYACGSSARVEATFKGVRVRIRWIHQQDDGGHVVGILTRSVFKDGDGAERLPMIPGRFMVLPSDWGPLGVLTDRERQIMGLIGMGLSDKQISDRTGRSVKTIQAHRRSLGKKLQVRNRVQLARLAIRAGLAPLQSEGTP